MSAAVPLVSVVVPTKDSARTIEACLRSVRAQDHPRVQLVVVDNGSTDGTAELAQEVADVAVQGGPERSAQRNLGVDLATGAWVLWVDSDMVLEPDVVSRAVAAATETGADAVFVRETSFGPGYWTACRRLERLCYLGEERIEAPRLVRRELLLQHRFDGEVAGQEDAALREVLRAAGARTTRSEGELHHDEGRLTLRGIVRKRLYYGRSIPAYAGGQPGAVRAQGLATVRALVRRRELLLADPAHAVGVMVMRVVEALAYALGAARGRATARVAAAEPGPCEVCGTPLRPRRLSGRDVLHVCPSCRHVQRSLDLCPAHARRHPWGGRRDLDRLRLALTYRRLRRAAPHRRPAVLELGFGTGSLLRRFADDGADVLGVDRDLLDVDVDPGLLAEGRLLRAPVEEAELPEGRFDLVYGVHVVEHVDDPAAVLAKARRALRPGGALVLLTPDGTSRGLALFRSHWWNLEDPTHVRFFSPASLTRALTDVGFVDVRVRHVRLDSLAMEATSLLRVLRRRSEPHGVLEHDWARAVVLALAPLSLLARLLVPGLSPTVEATARAPRA